MFLIAGLGNPGKKYARTRHNAGFMAVDLLRARLACAEAAERFESEVCRASAAGTQVMLLKPQTFMNLSGLAVGAAAGFHKVPPANVWILHDEIDLPLGRLRIRLGGSAGGHRGVSSVIEKLGTPEFIRFRIGIGRPAPGDPLPVDEYVVQPFRADELAAIEASVARAADAVETALKEGLETAMNRYNGA